MAPPRYPLLNAADIAPYISAAAVTPSDSVDLPGGVTRGIYIGGAGNVTVNMADGSNVTFTGMLVGWTYEIRCTRIFATGTTATNLVALY